MVLFPTKKSRREEWFRGFIYTLIISFIIFCVYLILRNHNGNKEIDENLAITEAVVYKSKYGMRASFNLYYKFEVDGKSYYNCTSGVGLKDFCIRKGKCEGLKFKVEYSRINPIHSRLIIGKKTYYGQIGSTEPL